VPRSRRFAASLVVTLAVPACSSSSQKPEEARWDADFAYVRKDGTACTYSTPERCPPNVTCNPPPPRAIECPRGMGEHDNARVGAVEGGACVMMAPGCHERACATETDCPDPGRPLLPLQWAVNPVEGQGDQCVATPARRTSFWETEHPPVTLTCPPTGAGFIERAAGDAACFACAQPPCDTATPVTCPDRL
jgi:hypothetical protein